MAQQEGIGKGKVDYYDIMLIGMTGQGKSTTAHKLLIANPTGQVYKAEDIQPRVPEEAEGKFVAQDISMWMLTEEDADTDKLETYIKAVAYVRTKSNPSQAVNEIRKSSKDTFTTTTKCEVLSNDTSKIRILDMPGFFDCESVNSKPATPTSPVSPVSPSAKPTSRVRQSSINVSDFNIGLMRDVIRIQAALGMKFRRILYFLPLRGPLERAHAILKLDLQAMAHMFGKSMLGSMVVIATITGRMSAKCNMTDDDKFPDEDKQITKELLLEAMRDVFEVKPGEMLPEPPIVFISLSESCESILDKVQQSKVSHENLTLEINPNICCDCGIKIGTINDDDKTRVTCSIGQDQSNSIPYDESTCHPRFKRSVLRRFVGQYIFSKVSHRWPSYKEEYCAECEKGPGKPGCMKIGQEFKYGWRKKSKITVDHSNVVQDPLTEEQIENEGKPADLNTDPAAEQDHRDVQQPQEYSTEAIGPSQITVHLEQSPQQDTKTQASPYYEDRKGT